MSDTVILKQLERWKAPRLDQPLSQAESMWTGYLTAENHQHVAERLRQLFTRPRPRRFSAVVAYEYDRWFPRLKTGLTLEWNGHPAADMNVHATVNDGYVHVGFSAGGTGWGWSSKLPDQPSFGRIAEGLSYDTWLEFGEDTFTAQHLTPERKGVAVVFRLEPEYRHVHELIAAAKTVAERTAVAPEWPELVARAEWDLIGG